LQPQNPREKGACHHRRIDLEADDLPPTIGSDIIVERMFEMPPRFLLVAQQMLRDTDHLLADQSVGHIGPMLGERAEPSCEFQSDAKTAIVNTKEP